MQNNMSLIFTVDENWAIGVNGIMLVDIPGDLKRFKDITYGNIVIMGRRTLEAIPGAEPLEGRTNIIFTRGSSELPDSVYTVGSEAELDELLSEINGDGEREVFVIGGGQIIKMLYHRCNKAYITKILKSFESSDTGAINLDEDASWKIVDESKVHSEVGVEYKYVEYEREI